MWDNKIELDLLLVKIEEKPEGLPSTGGSGQCVRSAWTPSTPWSSSSGMGRCPHCSRSVQRNIFLKVKTIKWNSYILQVVEARGFFHQQGALVSGVSVWLGLPVGRSGMGHCPCYHQPICANSIKSFLR